MNEQTFNGFDESAIVEVSRKMYQLSAMGLALTEAQLRARGNNCHAWFYKAVVQRLLAQMGALENEVKGIVGAQEIKSTGLDAGDLLFDKVNIR